MTQGDRQIGPYKLLELLGEGGFGSVWMAEQREPVKRRVALKIIKLGMDTKQVIARFEAERQALALMDHPHIAKVFDAGATDTGRPYFVMEYIKGVPIVEYCDQQRLDMIARLGLFTKVCHAIQHAHHKGIIHRDIKPNNVLVTMMDGAPIPKVIDFGIAKATNSELTTKTLFTEHRQMIGTPAYMSPEQAEMSGFDIDTRSDVYSLGVLLYEILTGTTPFDTKALLESGYAEMMRAIREDEPHTPSRRISSLGDTGTRTAQQRQVDQKRLGAQLRGDLDWIVMKCLEKDRNRRYDTANGLAADIQRHLKSEPVAAGPPGTAYKLRKFVRRNRGMVAAAAVVVAALVLGAAGTTTGMIRALDEKVRADGEADKAKRAAESEAAAKDEALRNERVALAAATSAEASQKEEETARKRAEAINQFVITTLQASDAVNPGGGQDVTILAAMDRAIADLDSGRFKDDPPTEAELKGTIGHILANNGRSREAEVLLEQAVESERRLAKGDSAGLSGAMTNLGLVLNDLGRREEARLLFVKVLDMNQRLYPGDHSAVTKSLSNLALNVAPEEGEALLRRALAMDRRLFSGDSVPVARDLLNLGSTLNSLGRMGEAEPLYAEAVEMGKRLHGGDHPFVAKALDNLGKARVQLGRPAEGLDLLTQALAMRRRLYKHPHLDLATGLHNLAAALSQQGRPAEAKPFFVEALEIRERWFEGDHWDTASTLNWLAGLELEQGRLTEAEPLCIRALEMRRRLAAGDHQTVTESLFRLAELRLAQGRPADAASLHAQSLEMLRRLHPGDHPDVAMRLRTIAESLRDGGHPKQAEPFALEAVEMHQRLSRGDNPEASLALNALGTAREAAGRPADAVPPLEAALAMDRRLLPAGHSDLLIDMGALASAYCGIKSYEKAIPLFEEASKGYEATLGRQDLKTLVAIGELGVNYRRVGRVAEAVPLMEEAWKGTKGPKDLQFVGRHLLDALTMVASPRNPDDTRKVVALVRDLIAQARDTAPPGNPELAGLLAQGALALLTVEVFDEAEPLLRECLAIREKAQPDAWRTFNTRSMLGGALLGQKRYAEAEPLLLAGYRGMKEREATIEASLGARIPEALGRLVNLYEAKGDATEAAAWRSKLEATRVAESKPAAPGEK